ncbi:RCC1 domain-containing protein [Brevibacillus brevis]|uniref:RCC1 domain-containing protein n=1 Tax=Brevibacillus brevis TaxID=1393 RepID=UPI000D10D359|nr:RCC1 domain-containing protein [Brevibacillus brevis]PSJ65416.1 hypothetical protein C7J99_29640 [Brevibacillus brevis]RED27994.1 alpha-tubulin suppressor-like RCC1 family protein [Brevibacillus brevis]GEC93678.1 hypothetical protein BBR01nite_60090 [Brevibacillus brevis]VEF87032.1 Cell cycle control protein [Brevibacillus brevis]
MFRLMLVMVSVCFALFSTFLSVQAAEAPGKKTPKIVAIATGAGHSLVLDDQGDIWGWGDSYYGQVGNWADLEGKGEEWHILRPTKAKHRVDGAVSLSAGINFSTALTKEGDVFSWGSNQNLALGFLPIELETNPIPEKLKEISDVKQVVASYARTTVRKSDGTVWVWGSRVWGQQLDDPGTTQESYKEFEKRLAEYRAALSTWGEKSMYEYIVQVKGVDRVVSIADGFSHTLALKEDGTVWSWGQESRGQLGNGSTNHNLLPTKVKGLENVTAIAAGFSLHNLAVKKDGTVWAWGNNNYGQLGDGTKTNRFLPVQVKGLTDVVSVAVGNEQSFAIKKDGSVWAWGRNTQGRLGLGTNTMENMIPAKVVGLTDVIAISSGYHHVLALKKDGTVWSWGVNESGQIGDGTQTRYGTSPETSDYHDKKVPVKVEFGLQMLTTTKPT